MPPPNLNGEVDTAINARAARLERRQNWHFVAIVTPVVLALLATAVGYGRLDGRVASLDESLARLVEHTDDMGERLMSTDIRQWDQINKFGPLLSAIASDLAFIRGLHEAGDISGGAPHRGSR
jgi:hypothetical protein